MKKIWFVVLAVLVLGLCGCGGGGDDGGDPSIDISGINQTGQISYPDGLYNLSISGTGHNVIFAAGLSFNQVDVSSIDSTAVINGPVDSLSVSGVNNRISCYSKPRTLQISGVNGTVHLPLNATPLVNLSGVDNVILYDLPAVP